MPKQIKLKSSQISSDELLLMSKHADREYATGKLQKQLRELQKYGKRQAKKLGIKPGDVNRLIAEYRQEQHQKNI